MTEQQFRVEQVAGSTKSTTSSPRSNSTSVAPSPSSNNSTDVKEQHKKAETNVMKHVATIEQQLEVEATTATTTDDVKKQLLLLEERVQSLLEKEKANFKTQANEQQVKESDMKKQMQSALDREKNNSKKLEEQVKSLTKELEKEKANSKTLNEKVQSLSKDLEKEKTRATTANEQLDEANNKIDSLQDKLDVLTVPKEFVLLVRSNFGETIKKHEQTIATLEKEKKDLEKQLTQKDRAVSKAEKDLSISQSEKERIEKDNKRLRDELDESRKKAKNDLEELRRNEEKKLNESLTTARLNHEKLVEDMKRQHEQELHATNNRHNKEKEALFNERSSLETKVSQLEDQIRIAKALNDPGLVVNDFSENTVMTIKNEYLQVRAAISSFSDDLSKAIEDKITEEEMDRFEVESEKELSKYFLSTLQNLLKENKYEYGCKPLKENEKKKLFKSTSYTCKQVVTDLLENFKVDTGIVDSGDLFNSLKDLFVKVAELYFLMFTNSKKLDFVWYEQNETFNPFEQYARNATSLIKIKNSIYPSLMHVATRVVYEKAKVEVKSTKMK